jgi:3-oxoacyl-[acyl-carrier-protein] synthase II
VRGDRCNSGVNSTANAQLGLVQPDGLSGDRTVVVTGIGLISALGSLESTWKRLLAGESGISRHQPFTELSAYPLALLGEHPAFLDAIVEPVVRDALLDAGLFPPLKDCSVVVGSSRGNQGRLEQLLRDKEQIIGATSDSNGCSFAAEKRGIVAPDAYRLPPAFSHPGKVLSFTDLLPHAAAIATAQFIQTNAAVRSPMAACATGLWAIAQGAELIRSGEYDRVLAGAVEAPITPLTLAGFDRMGALAKTGAYPFDRDREGLVLGEGGAVLVLESAELASQRGAQLYGSILGAGLSADGYHVSAPQPESTAAIAAIRQCLHRSHLHPQAIDYIHAHGTATQRNDANEASMIANLFSRTVPVSSTKGATGHMIGASGALGVAFCLLALKHQLLPPNTGVRHPDFDLNFVRHPRPAALNHALCLGFGFGGQNAAIAVRAIPP